MTVPLSPTRKALPAISVRVALKSSCAVNVCGPGAIGRTTWETDARDETTLFEYDNFDRLTINTLPGGAKVQRHYADHSSEDLPTKISVDGVVLGEQSWNGLGLLTDSTTGGRTQYFTYKPGQTQPATKTNARNQVIEFEYVSQLTDEPSVRRLPGKTPATYQRDGKNARLLSCVEDGLELKRQYFSTGEVKSEERVQGNQSWVMHYDFSRQGLLRSYTDVLKQTQTFDYKKNSNQLLGTVLGTTSSNFTYDSLGQTQTISTQDSGSNQYVTISLHYDGLGREIKRQFDLNGVIQVLTQVYNKVDALVERTLTEGPNQTLLRKETYDYDPRGRLVLYQCEGTQPPVDPYGKAIISQLFKFDALDNITRVQTTSSEGVNTAVYTYDTLDPVQLSKVTNSGVPGYPPEIRLSYDADGHMKVDEEGRNLEYDEVGRLKSVSALPGEAPSYYGYNPLDTLAVHDNGSVKVQRFYQGDELANLVEDNDNNNTFVRGAGVLLAEHQEGAGKKP
ncbi:hypothetical protein PS918_02555 [Pseudomonas fluorescens]|uniref:YD repeat-containing protein n=1 Tax=Pseudomonas fluorescens TaxID=294 RepID=A0A5E7SC52_PSEFL|nr:hypothetical protein [Pseudomonas fluorescens]VVP83620.1 hypothetical protein PS918_02555 [Pseudomonas fluorescens]